MKYLGFLFIFIANFGFAQVSNLGFPTVPGIESRAAGCVSPTGSIFLELNNVKALIHTAGNLWQIQGQNNSIYEVPKGSGIMALFTSSLWLGGLDFNGQLKLAALRYRSGQDYWTGPLTTDGTAEITPEVCNEFDRHFKISKEEVQQFSSWYNAGLADNANGTNTQSKNFPEYEIPASILEWPAHGDVTLDQPYYLAPFYDNPLAPGGKNGLYDPINDGDYPWYDIAKDVECQNSREVTLFGDETLWWIMNDKGNIHTETGGDPLGMEIRAQAFAFATNNEIDNMTFYNYELINRSTQTLYNTYFGVMVDVALGGPNDDYVGCDVSRGLGYCYNGDNFDEDMGGFKGYGDMPAAVGVDFFEGPYQDNDEIDNPLTENITEAQNQNGIPYKGLGIGYGDGVVDNERFGMRRFLYYNNIGTGNINQTDPQIAIDYYRYLTGFWKDGSPFVYGGSGHSSDAGANTSVLADFMFPGTTDPLGWGTGGVPQESWTEESSNNIPFDRRFAQSAGPFILKPGAVNNITVGVVWARSTTGVPFESVVELQKADDKAQSLFDNCFKILEGPHAPDLNIQELENELIITILNPQGSNNLNESYSELDPEIINVDEDSIFDPNYRFQGYQVYQLASKDVASNELSNPAKARLVFQCDIEDDISTLVNYNFDLNMGAQVPTVEVKGNNEGIKHSFQITKDLFASGDTKLVNFKKYYFMAIAYASNNFKTYDPNVAGSLNGQKKPYLGSRKAAFGEVKAYLGIPHEPRVEGLGTTFGTYYGWSPQIKQIDGYGNGARVVNLTENTKRAILENGSVDIVEYAQGSGPIDVKVIDPLNLKPGKYDVKFEQGVDINWGGIDSTSTWSVTRDFDGQQETISSPFPIDLNTEVLFPQWGISVSIKQSKYMIDDPSLLQSFWWRTEPIYSEMTFSDSTGIWLQGMADSDLNYPTNWIRSGTNVAPTEDDPTCSADLWISNPCYYYDRDEFGSWKDMVGGSISPFKYVGYEIDGMPSGSPGDDPTTDNTEGYAKINSSFFRLLKLEHVHDVDIVITSDKTKWTKCVVLEMNHNENQTVGGSDVLEIRNQNSVNKEGKVISSEKGMGWFPGYAIDVANGQRLNMAFGENSWLPGDNGDDMIWNPTSNISTTTGVPILGGMHYVYVFNVRDGMPKYDEGKYMRSQLSLKTKSGHENVFENCMWVFAPILSENGTLLDSDVSIKARISKPYTTKEITNSNNGYPHYTFEINDSEAPRTNVTSELESLLDIINIVPNPYYGYSSYEESRLDKVVKITNLPKQCNIKIFNMSGQLIKQFTKDTDITSIDWSLTNEVGVPIASGVYIVHIEVPGVGEKILKWMCNMRREDFDNL
ncbi:MAG: T9SS type A sorting domain-containing protein [Crocinitomicaceae bacterium]